MASTSGRALGSRQIREQLHDDSFSEISQDAYIDITEPSDSDDEINRPDLSDNGGNSDGGQSSANVVVVIKRRR
jgi:hypothetical protein